MANDPDGTIIRRELDTDADNPAVTVAQTVADIEGTDATDLPSMYDCIDGMLDELFSTPPAPEAMMEISFNYANYRITVSQNGVAEFVRV